MSDGPPAEARTIINHYTKDQSGKPIAGALVRFTDQVTGMSFERSSDGSGYSNIAGPITHNPYTRSIFANGFQMLVDYHTPTAPEETMEAVLSFKVAGGTTRSGLVRIHDRVWSDDVGDFRPLGATLFWTVWGWTNDQARLIQTFSWLAQRGVNFIRILGDVDWSGWDMQMDSSTPDWESVLGACIDAAWEHNLRTELTLWGGSGRDPLNCAQRAVNVVGAGRQHKVLAIEMANESFQNGPSDEVMGEMLDICNPLGLLTAMSSPGTSNDQLNDYVDRGARKGTVHPDRNQGAHGERMVRQMWDFRNYHFGINNNEPAGPRSSVAECVDPSKLAMLRAMGIFCGVGAFVLHNGNGVSGKPDPAHNRGGDLWTVPNIDAIHAAVYVADKRLPIGVETWNKTTQHGGYAYDGFENYGQPLAADSIWSDGILSYGCDRCYGAVAGSEFITMVSDVVDHVELRAGQHCSIVAYNVASAGTIGVYELQAGQTCQLSGNVPDVVIYGTFL